MIGGGTLLAGKGGTFTSVVVVVVTRTELAEELEEEQDEQEVVEHGADAEEVDPVETTVCRWVG